LIAMIIRRATPIRSISSAGDQSRLAWASRGRDEPGNKIPPPRIWMRTCLVSLLHFVSVEKS